MIVINWGAEATSLAAAHWPQPLSACPHKLGLGASERAWGAQNGLKQSSAGETSCQYSKSRTKQLLGFYRSAGLAASRFSGGMRQFSEAHFKETQDLHENVEGTRTNPRTRNQAQDEAPPHCPAGSASTKSFDFTFTKKEISLQRHRK